MKRNQTEILSQPASRQNFRNFIEKRRKFLSAFVQRSSPFVSAASCRKLSLPKRSCDIMIWRTSAARFGFVGFLNQKLRQNAAHVRRQMPDDKNRSGKIRRQTGDEFLQSLKTVRRRSDDDNIFPFHIAFHQFQKLSRNAPVVGQASGKANSKTNRTFDRD